MTSIRVFLVVLQTEQARLESDRDGGQYLVGIITSLALTEEQKQVCISPIRGQHLSWQAEDNALASIQELRCPSSPYLNEPIFPQGFRGA